MFNKRINDFLSHHAYVTQPFMTFLVLGACIVKLLVAIEIFVRENPVSVDLRRFLR
ncbi:321_t:CDS:1, partial [Acaulospora morrowiae]